MRLVQSMDFLAFCAASRAILLGKDTPVPGTIEKAAAMVGIEGEVSKDRFAHAVSGFIDDPSSPVWGRLRPGFDLLHSSPIFAEYAQAVMASGKGYYSSVPYQESSECGKSPETLFDLIATTRLFFRGAALYAYEQGALSYAERLLWWGVMACEWKGLRVDELFVDPLIKIYRKTGRVTTADRLHALKSLRASSEKELWLTDLESLAQRASCLYEEFRNYRGNYTDRCAALSEIKNDFQALVQCMAQDPAGIPLVAKSLRGLTTQPVDKKAGSVLVRNSTDDIRSSGFYYSHIYLEWVPADLGILLRKTSSNTHEIIFPENTQRSRWAMFQDLLKPYLHCVAVIALLEEHVERVGQLPKVSATFFKAVCVEKYRHLASGGGTAKEVKELLAMMEVVGASELDVTLYWDRLYTLVVHTILREGSYIVINKKDEELYATPVKKVEGFEIELNMLLEERSDALLQTISAWSSEQKRSFALKLLGAREIIEGVYKKEKRSQLIDFLDQFWNAAPDCWDIALWADALDNVDGHLKRSHERMMRLRQHCDAVGVVEQLNAIASLTVYPDYENCPSSS